MNATNRDQAGARNVIVTGAGGGLGRAIAVRLVRDGFRCVAAGRDKSKLERTEELADPTAEQVYTLPCDLREPADRERLIRFAAGLDGVLFGLVNNAGVARAYPLLEESLPDWRETFEVNLEAAYFLSQAAVEHMRRQGSGRIVNIASAYGTMAFDNRGYGDRAPDYSEGDRGPFRQSAYAASKGGLLQLTRDLAAAVGRWGVTVNAVSPGSIPHPHEQLLEAVTRSDRRALAGEEKPGLGDRVDPKILQALAAQVPLGRLGRVEEVAGPVSFLLSADADYITGVNLPVDGGWTVW